MGEEWSDALILVPDAAQYTEVLERPEYSAALDLIKTAYRKEHADRLGGNLKELCDEGFDSRVFTQQNLEDLVTGLRELSRTARMQGRQVAPKEMDELINRFEKTPPIIWNPVVLSSGLASKQFGENWAILQKWQEWDRQQFLCPQCAEEYYGEPQNRKQVDIFRKRLKYLGLPLWVTDTKAMRQEQRRLRSLIPKAELEARREAKRLKKQSFTIK